MREEGREIDHNKDFARSSFFGCLDVVQVLRLALGLRKASSVVATHLARGLTRGAGDWNVTDTVRSEGAHWTYRPEIDLHKQCHMTRGIGSA